MCKFSRRGVQIVLGCLWLIDGALQVQHQMFTSNFATQVIMPAADGQPRFVSGPMHFGIHIFLLHPALCNALFAIVQLGIGVLILWKRTVRFGLLGSIVWGLAVWVFGEGYGGVFSGHTLLLMGAPGAAILYVFLALVVLPGSKEANYKKQAPAYWLAFVWLVIWVGGGVYQLLPGQNTPSDLSGMIAANADGAPGWLATIDTHVARAIKNLDASTAAPSGLTAAGMHMTTAQMTHMTNEPQAPTQSGAGYVLILLLVATQMAIGLGVLFAGVWRKLAIGAGMSLSILFWIVGQSLGGYFTGLATDPNSGPLFVLLGLTILGSTDLDLKLRSLGRALANIVLGKPHS